MKWSCNFAISEETQLNKNCILCPFAQQTSIMARFDMDLYQSPFSWDAGLQGGLGVYMVSLALWAVVGWVLLLLPRPTSAPAPMPVVGEAEEDKDVAAERIKQVVAVCYVYSSSYYYCIVIIYISCYL